MPFRSETEHLREQIRRIDEQATELQREGADLRRQFAVTDRPRRRRRHALGILALVGAGALGYGAGLLLAAKNATAKLRAAQTVEERAELERVFAAQRVCAKDREAVDDELGWCLSELDRDRAAESLRRLPGEPSPHEAGTHRLDP